MTLEEYKKRAAEQEDLAPGWKAIDEAFEKLYLDQKPAHFGTELMSRAISGGDEYLDGYSIYQSLNGYMHLLTYGMTELYTDEEAFGGDWSRYTYTRKRFFEPMQFIAGNGTTLHIGVESAITALFIVNDTECERIDTVHGSGFMQLVGITQRELEVLKEDPQQAAVLYEKMQIDNPYMITDMKRVNSYL